MVRIPAPLTIDHFITLSGGGESFTTVGKVAPPNRQFSIPDPFKVLFGISFGIIVCGAREVFFIKTIIFNYYAVFVDTWYQPQPISFAVPETLDRIGAKRKASVSPSFCQQAPCIVPFYYRLAGSAWVLGSIGKTSSPFWQVFLNFCTQSSLFLRGGVSLPRMTEVSYSFPPLYA